MPQLLDDDPVIDPQEANKYRDDLNVKILCPDCRNDPPNLIEDFSAGDTICGDCGVVLGERIVDSRSEWRTFANDESGGDDPSRVGKAQGAFDEGEGLETSVGFSEGSGSRDLQRAQQKASGGRSDKHLNDGLAQVSLLCSRLGLESRVQDSAKQIWQMISKNPKNFKNKNADALVAACVFQGCRQQQQPRSFKEINVVAKVSKKEVGKMHRLLEAYLRKKKEDETKQGIPSMQNGHPSLAGYKAEQGAASAHEYVRRHGRTLALPQKVITIALGILDRTNHLKDLVGRSPLTTAAAAMHYAALLCGIEKHTKEYATICQISDGTIRQVYKYMYEHCAAQEWQLDPEWFKPPYSIDTSRLHSVSTKHDSKAKAEAAAS